MRPLPSPSRRGVWRSIPRAPRIPAASSRVATSTNRATSACLGVRPPSVARLGDHPTYPVALEPFTIQGVAGQRPEAPSERLRRLLELLERIADLAPAHIGLRRRVRCHAPEDGRPLVPHHGATRPKAAATASSDVTSACSGIGRGTVEPQPAVRRLPRRRGDPEVLLKDDGAFTRNLQDRNSTTCWRAGRSSSFSAGSRPSATASRGRRRRSRSGALRRARSSLSGNSRVTNRARTNSGHRRRGVTRSVRIEVDDVLASREGRAPDRDYSRASFSAKVKRG
jgi:hypothetical protein